MAHANAIAHHRNSHAHLVIRRITLNDVRDAIAKGIEDFVAKPSHVFFIGLLYPMVGLILGRLAFGYEMLPIVFPLVAGFTLLGPILTIGFYEISRRREQGLSATWRDAANVTRSRSRWSILALGLVLFAVFLAWLRVAELLYTRIFGADAVPSTVTGFIRQILETEQGWELIIVGNAIGFLFALFIFSISVVSFPLLLDRDVSAPLAAITSVRAVMANPVPMLAWGLTVVSALVLGSLPFLLGLAVVVPVLGHATWHLYRRVVE